MCCNCPLRTLLYVVLFREYLSFGYRGRSIISISILSFFSLCNPFFHHQPSQPKHQSNNLLSTNQPISTLRSNPSRPPVLHNTQTPHTTLHNNGIQTYPNPCLLPHFENSHQGRTPFRSQHFNSHAPQTRQLNLDETHLPHRRHIHTIHHVSHSPIHSPSPHSLLLIKSTALFSDGLGWQLACSKKPASDYSCPSMFLSMAWVLPTA